VPKLAEAYAVNIMAVYNNYRWRYVNSPGAHSAGNAVSANDRRHGARFDRE